MSKHDINLNIKPDIKLNIEAPTVLEQLETHEQVQPAEGTVAPTASLPSPPSQPSPLPSPKAKKPWERATGADAISAAQWVWSYLEDNYRVPKWWREFQSLLLDPCDPAIQKLSHLLVVVFWISATQVEKNRW